jgi:hypothetical protein
MKWMVAWIFLVMMGGAGSADDFQSSYLKFSLPNGWTCNLEQTEFVCNPPHLASRRRPAIMILSAKVVGPDDTLTAYVQRLNAMANATGPDSMIQPPKYSLINGINWVDCTIEGSEVKNYKTRYLAVAKNGLAILYTFSAHKDYFDKLEGSAVLAVNTLQMLDDWKK